jgi:hypothetical protein
MTDCTSPSLPDRCVRLYSFPRRRGLRVTTSGELSKSLFVTHCFQFTHIVFFVVDKEIWKFLFPFAVAVANWVAHLWCILYGYLLADQLGRVPVLSQVAATHGTAKSLTILILACLRPFPELVPETAMVRWLVRIAVRVQRQIPDPIWDPRWWTLTCRQRGAGWCGEGARFSCMELEGDNG